MRGVWRGSHNPASVRRLCTRRRERQGACHFVEHRFAFTSLGDGCYHAPSRQNRHLVVGVDERQSCFAQLGFSDRPRRGRLSLRRAVHPDDDHQAGDVPGPLGLSFRSDDQPA